MADRTRVLWVLKGLGPGGAERLVVDHAAAGDRAAFDYEVAYLLPWKQHLVPELEALGIATHCLHVRSPADPRWVLRLRRLVHAGRFDVVHLHSPALAAIARPALRLGRDRPGLVYTEHNRWPSYHRVTRMANRLTVGLDDANVAVSDDVRASMGTRGEPVEVIVHGIDTERVRRHLADREAVRAELGVAPGELLAVTVANLRAKKGYPDLIRAARIVVDTGAAVRFVAAGQGPDEGELRRLVGELGLEERFRLLGYVPDAARLLAGADLFVLASEHEGLPLAVMEALALGVPVVATRVGGIPELVEDGVSGRLVAPRDPAALADAVLAVTDAGTRARLAHGAEARGGAVDGRRAIGRLDRIYAEVAGRCAAPEGARPVKVAHLTTTDMSLRLLLLAQLRALRDAGAEVVGISAPGPWVADLEREGIRHVALASSTRSMDPLADLRAATELWRVLRQERPTVLHVHNPKPGVYGRIVGRLARVPIVVNTVHGLYATEADPWPKRALVYALEAIAARCSDAELVQNPEDLELLHRKHISPHARLLGNGVDLERFRPDVVGDRRRAARAALGIPDDVIVVGSVGRLVAEKGFPELFDAVARLDPDRYVLIVMGGADRSKADALDPAIVDRAQAGGVRILGHRDDVADLYAAMDLFVLASHREGYPRAAMEAAASGLPLVVTDIRGCRQVVDDERNGVLVPVRDAGALARAIEHLGGDADRRAAMGHASRTIAGQRFDEQAVVSTVLDTYREIAIRKGVPLPLA